MPRLSLAALASLLALLSSTATLAADVEVTFSTRERQIIVEYYRSQIDAAEPRGKKGKKEKGLPPGIAKNLARGKPLPPGIAKTRLPAELTAKLPPPPKGHEVVIVDGRVLLVEIATQVIRDKLEDVILR
jgi:hypothetical protein